MKTAKKTTTNKEGRKEDEVKPIAILFLLNNNRKITPNHGIKYRNYEYYYFFFRKLSVSVLRYCGHSELHPLKVRGQEREIFGFVKIKTIFLYKI